MGVASLSYKSCLALLSPSYCFKEKKRKASQGGGKKKVGESRLNCCARRFSNDLRGVSLLYHCRIRHISFKSRSQPPLLASFFSFSSASLSFLFCPPLFTLKFFPPLSLSLPFVSLNSQSLLLFFLNPPFIESKTLFFCNCWKIHS